MATREHTRKTGRSSSSRGKSSVFINYNNKRFFTPVLAALIATLVVVGLLLVHVWSRYRVLALGYEMSRLTQEREDLLEANRRLRLEVRVLSRADRLDPMARRQLGLIVPKAEQIIYKRAADLPLPNFPSSDVPELTEQPPVSVVLPPEESHDD